jgi:hypothetical protein
MSNFGSDLAPAVGADPILTTSQTGFLADAVGEA